MVGVVVKVGRIVGIDFDLVGIDEVFNLELLPNVLLDFGLT